MDFPGELTIDCAVLGPFATNCYILTIGGTAETPSPFGGGGPSGPVGALCWLVDPGLFPEVLVEHLRHDRLVPRRILITHGHGDHIAGIIEVKRAWPEAVVTAPAGDAHMLTDPVANASAEFGFNLVVPTANETVAGGQELAMGGLVWKVLDTSGHTAGSVSYYCPQAGVVLTGDALFEDSVGRTDLPNASHAQLIGNIRRHLLSLPDATTVLPGHGPATTIGRERKFNPYLQPDE